MNISYFIKYLLVKKWIIIIPTFVAIAATWLLSLRQSKTYTSTAELSTGYMEINPLADNRFPNNTVLFNNVLQTLQSKQILDQVAYRLLLHDLSTANPYRLPPDLTQSQQLQKGFPGGKEGLILYLTNKADSFYVLNMALATDRKIGEIIGIYGYSTDNLLSKITVKRIQESDFIDITVTTENPALSAVIANHVCQSFLELYQTRIYQSSTVSLDTLRTIMDAKKQLLDNKLQLLQGQTDFSGLNNTEFLATLQSQLTQQRTNLIQAQASLDNDNQQLTIAAKRGSGLAGNEEIITLRTNIDNLYSKYVSGGSSDIALLDQINKLRTEYQQKLNLIGNNNAGIPMNDLLQQKNADQIKVNVATQTINELQHKINQLSGSVESPSKAAIAEQLKNEIDVARQEYTNANTTYNSALNRNIFPGNNFRQSLIASPSLAPDQSQRLKIVGLAGIGILFLIIFSLLFIEFVDPSVKTPSFLKQSINIPLLASLQHFNIKRITIEDLFSSDGSASPMARKFKEQIKQLRYEIEKSQKKIFLVTGYLSSAGTTTLTKALSNSLTLNNRSVLLIDANFKNNTLTKYYNANPTLESISPAKDSNIGDLVTSTENKNIQIIGCRSGGYTPSEVLPQRNVFTRLKENIGDYDYVFIDTASLSQGSDSKELLQYVDAVIILFAADQPIKDDAINFVEFLKNNDNNPLLLGMVLNRINSYNMEI